MFVGLSQIVLIFLAEDSGGILVREAKDLKSEALTKRLAKDSEIQQLDLIGHWVNVLIS